MHINLNHFCKILKFFVFAISFVNKFYLFENISNLLLKTVETKSNEKLQRLQQHYFTTSFSDSSKLERLHANMQLHQLLHAFVIGRSRSISFGDQGHAVHAHFDCEYLVNGDKQSKHYYCHHIECYGEALNWNLYFTGSVAYCKC